ncbi:hypothetical protein G4B88_022226 [Cannabis sativa]|uniref:SHSP domain-containing protein n=1 Tax=Cannabis sativa TaxID=3483 RepID=A0A7J6G0P4_CANSA|nr:hypothetical protein G4B88_022226 [Cannabis sativa]
MELELGLKITKSTDDITSTTTNLRIAKDSSGPVFISRETDTKFILTAHLKEGTEISISGERPVRELVMSGWMMQKKEVELKGFIKVFRIPDGVILDRIKAKFNNQESVLTIVIPKSSKGIRGVGIEEVKEEEVVNKDETDHATISEEQTHKIMPRTEELKVDEPKSDESNGVDEKKVEEKIEGAHDVFDEMSKRNETRIEPEIITNEETFQEIKPTQPLPSEEEAKRKELPGIKEETCEEGLEPVHVIEENKDEDKECSSSCGGDDESAMVEKQEAIEEKGKDKASGGSSRRIKLCVPCVIAGSTIIVSIVVFAVHWIRTKKREVH